MCLSTPTYPGLTSTNKPDERLPCELRSVSFLGSFVKILVFCLPASKKEVRRERKYPYHKRGGVWGGSDHVWVEPTAAGHSCTGVPIQQGRLNLTPPFLYTHPVCADICAVRPSQWHISRPPTPYALRPPRSFASSTDSSALRKGSLLLLLRALHSSGIPLES